MKQLQRLWGLIVLYAFTFSPFAHSANADTTPEWLTDLMTLNVGLIDSVSVYPAHPDAPEYTTYVIYYNQPLEHSQPGSPRFPLRALITVRRDSDPTTAVNHVYCSGYGISANVLASPDSTLAAEIDCSTEIARRYNANYISIEHRYFFYSAPAQCWTNLDPLRAEEAAADFHNLFEGLKQVLKGKWVMSGVSKGGITTLIQHAYYPGDMDIFVPYSAPFFEVLNDTTMQTYWYNHGWNQTYRDMFMNVRKVALTNMATDSNNAIWAIYSFLYGRPNAPQEHVDSLYGSYLHSVAEFGFMDHAYNDTATIHREMFINDSVILANGWNAYNDTALAFMISNCSYSMKKIQPWLDTLRKYTHLNQKPALRLQRRNHLPFGITEKEWWLKPDHSECRAYDYQATCELGYYDYRFDQIANTPAEAEVFNSFWRTKVGNANYQNNPCFLSRSFSRSLYDRVMDATRNATKPILLIYGDDDTWTGAAVKDEFVNGSNVRKFILPSQNHAVSFTSDTDITLCYQIRAALDAVLSTPDGIENVMDEWTNGRRGESNGEGANGRMGESNGVWTKVLRNGVLLIECNGKTYTAQGQMVHGK